MTHEEKLFRAKHEQKRAIEMLKVMGAHNRVNRDLVYPMRNLMSVLDYLDDEAKQDNQK